MWKIFHVGTFNVFDGFFHLVWIKVELGDLTRRVRFFNLIKARKTGEKIANGKTREKNSIMKSVVGEKNC